MEATRTEAGGTAAPSPASLQALAAARSALGLSRFGSVRVVHCAHSFGAVLESGAGWKLVFSGDTRPCALLTEAATGATLLIHEATFDDSMEV